MMHHGIVDAVDSSSLAPPSAEPVGVRLRLLACRLERRPGARSRVRVELEGPRGSERIVVEREDTSCPAGDLRLAAQATLDAMVRATSGALRVELIGAKPVRAFDSTIAVVAVLLHDESVVTKVVGAAMAEDDLLQATARAALDAVNRRASPLLAQALGQG